MGRWSAEDGADTHAGVEGRSVTTGARHDPDPTDEAGPMLPENRRGREDRRDRPTPMLGRFTFLGRRRWVRRDKERRGSYVDRPGAWMYAVLTIVLTLSVLDAVFTLIHLQRGGREVNPIMDWAIGLGPVAFLAIKCALTVSGMLLLVLHRFFGGVRFMLAGVLGIYGLLMIYHVILSGM